MVKAGQVIRYQFLFGLSIEKLKDNYVVVRYQTFNEQTIQTHVCHTSKLFQTLMTNQYAFKLIDQKDFLKYNGKFSPEDQKTMQQEMLNTICSLLTSYAAVNEAHKSQGVLSYMKLYYSDRLMITQRMLQGWCHQKQRRSLKNRKSCMKVIVTKRACS